MPSTINTIIKHSITIVNLMFSDKTLREIVYPVLKFLLFLFSSIFLFFVLNASIGAIYSEKGGVKYSGNLLPKLIISIFINIITIFLLFLISHLCKVKLTTKTCIWMISIHLFILILSLI
ncbi:hypothetical protein ABIB40_003058 [Pedobacter sp. UYP30]